MEKNKLLLIGIDKYLHSGSLGNCKRDCSELAKVLNNKYGFQEADTIKIFDEQATKLNIFGILNSFAESTNNDENLIIFYAGQGFYEKSLGYWVPYEGDNRGYSCISNREILDLLDSIQAKHIFLIIDCCFSGAIFSGSSKNMNIELKENLPSRMALTSGRNESVIDGPPGQGSPFASSIIKSLHLNTNHKLPVSKLALEIQKDMIVSYNQAPMFGRINTAMDKGGELILKTNANGIDEESIEYSSSQLLKIDVKEYNSIIQSIANGRFEKGIKRLLELNIGLPDENSIALLSGKFFELNRRKLLGLPTNEEQYNEIIFAVLEIIKAQKEKYGG